MTAGRGVRGEGRGMLAAIVLAAGAARRFGAGARGGERAGGAQKLTVPLHGKPLVRWSVERALASCARDVVVVLGREAGAVRLALDGLPVRFVVNDRYADGMSTSLSAGVAALDAMTDAAVVLLGDQPGVTPDIIDALAGAWADARRAGDGGSIVVPVYAGVRGNPVLFDVSVFPELAAVRGDRGARDVIARDPVRVRALPLPLAVPLDVDTPADHAALSGRAAPGERS